MNLRENALGLLEQAQARLRTVEWALVAGNLPYAVRSSQEAVELALKAALEWVNIDYPKVHDVSDALREVSAKFPLSFRRHLDEMAGISEETARLRAAATYGLETTGQGPTDIFRNREEVARIARQARNTVRYARGLLTDGRGRRRRTRSPIRSR